MGALYSHPVAALVLAVVLVLVYRKRFFPSSPQIPSRAGFLANRTFWVVVLALLVLSVLPFRDVILATISWPFADELMTKELLKSHVTGKPFVVLFVLSQALFLMPRGRYRIRLTNTGRPSWKAVVVGGMIAGALSLGLFIVLMEFSALVDVDFAILSGQSTSLTFLLTFLFSWVAWGVLLYRIANRTKTHDAFTQFLFARLLSSSLLLYFLSQIIFGYHRFTKRESCECAVPSLWAMMISITVIFWLFGPGIFFVLSSRSRSVARVMHNAGSPGVGLPRIARARIPFRRVMALAGVALLISLMLAFSLFTITNRPPPDVMLSLALANWIATVFCILLGLLVGYGLRRILATQAAPSARGSTRAEAALKEFVGFGKPRLYNMFTLWIPRARIPFRRVMALVGVALLISLMLAFALFMITNRPPPGVMLGLALINFVVAAFSLVLGLLGWRLRRILATQAAPSARISADAVPGLDEPGEPGEPRLPTPFILPKVTLVLGLLGWAIGRILKKVAPPTAKAPGDGEPPEDESMELEPLRLSFRQKICLAGVAFMVILAGASVFAANRFAEHYLRERLKEIGSLALDAPVFWSKGDVAVSLLAGEVTISDMLLEVPVSSKRVAVKRIAVAWSPSSIIDGLQAKDVLEVDADDLAVHYSEAYFLEPFSFTAENDLDQGDFSFTSTSMVELHCGERLVQVLMPEVTYDYGKRDAQFKASFFEIRSMIEEGTHLTAYDPSGTYDWNSASIDTGSITFRQRMAPGGYPIRSRHMHTDGLHATLSNNDLRNGALILDNLVLDKLVWAGEPIEWNPFANLVPPGFTAGGRLQLAGKGGGFSTYGVRQVRINSLEAYPKGASVNVDSVMVSGPGGGVLTDPLKANLSFRGLTVVSHPSWESMDGEPGPHFAIFEGLLEGTGYPNPCTREVRLTSDRMTVDVGRLFVDPLGAFSGDLRAWANYVHHEEDATIDVKADLTWPIDGSFDLEKVNINPKGARDALSGYIYTDGTFRFRDINRVAVDYSFRVYRLKLPESGTWRDWAGRLATSWITNPNGYTKRARGAVTIDRRYPVKPQVEESFKDAMLDAAF